MSTRSRGSTRCGERISRRLATTFRLTSRRSITYRAHLDAIADHLAYVCAGTRAMPVIAESVRFLGRGVAIVLASPPFERLRADLARHWSASLTPQDRQPFRPHVTVQNKVSAAEAQALYTRLQAEFVPFAAKGIGLCLWRYKGGPWEPLGKFRFTASDRA
jgi:2'-5' RNA ligase